MPIHRRTFLKATGAISAATILKPSIVFGTKANSAIRMGIIGCGNRGTAVISSFLKNTNTNIVAMADLFEDKLQAAKNKFNKLNTDKNFSEIPQQNMYHGSKAYLQLLENKDVDAVLISSPAYTHPWFLEAAVDAGKHVYCEKPVAPDIAGCKKVLQIGEKLNKNLSAVIGFQIRYATPYVEMVKRIQQGAIGELISAQLYYFSSGSPVYQLKNVSDDEFRIRNHYHFHALSGGIFLDQIIHMLDVCNWTLQANPVNAFGRGNRNGDPGIGDTWSNYQVIYQYPNDINVSTHATKVGPAFGDVCCRFIGSKGSAEAHYSGGVFIKGDNAWDSGVSRTGTELTPEQQASGVFLSSLDDADANKEKAFIESIEKGKYLNNLQSGAESTLTAILGRNAAESKKETTWNEVIASNEKFDPKLNLSQFDKA